MNTFIDQIINGCATAGAIFWSGVVLFAIVKLIGA